MKVFNSLVLVLFICKFSYAQKLRGVNCELIKFFSKQEEFLDNKKVYVKGDSSIFWTDSCNMKNISVGQSPSNIYLLFHKNKPLYVKVMAVNKIKEENHEIQYRVILEISKYHSKKILLSPSNYIFDINYDSVKDNIISYKLIFPATR